MTPDTLKFVTWVQIPTRPCSSLINMAEAGGDDNMDISGVDSVALHKVLN